MNRTGPTPADGPLRLALFDCDGTLVDSQYAIIAAMSAAFRAFGLGEPPADRVRRVVGLPLADAVARLLPGTGRPRCETIAEAYKQAFFEQRREAEHAEPLFPGLAAALDALEEAGLVLGIATGKSRRGLLATLERHGLGDRFATLQTSDGGPGKPHPDMVYRALAETGVEAADTVVIGDTTFDVEMARNAGIPAVGVSWGYHDPAELLAAGARCIVHDYADVPVAVLKLLDARPPR